MLINQSAQVARLCEELRGAPYVAVDTEFMRERTFWPQLCLVQVAHGETAAAIDVLAGGIDLRPLFTLLSDRGVIKVLHSAMQDLEVFYNLMGSLPGPLFDTQIAAGFCGFGEQPGYASLISTLVGVEVDKASQFTDWARRPLSPRQLHYALNDVTLLCRAYERLLELLEKSGRLAWAEAEMAPLADERQFQQRPRDYWQRIRLRQPQPRGLAILREVAAWREEAAMSRNLPRNWVVRDEVLAQIASHPPGSVGELAQVRGLGDKTAHGEDGRALLAAVDRALAMPASDWPALPPRRPSARGQESLIALLKALLQLRSDESGIAAPQVASREDLDLLCSGQHEDLRILSGWRRELFGADALALCQGKLSLTGIGGEVKVVPLQAASGRPPARP